MVDMVLYCDLETSVGDGGEQRMRRVIRTKPSRDYEAGDRTGRLPETLDLDYAEFYAAFHAAVAPLKPQASTAAAAK